MNGNYSKEFILLILFITTTYSSMIPFLSTTRCGQDWENGEFPSFVPESKQARREYCDLHERMKLSRNQLDNIIGEWAMKYNVWDKFKLDFDEDAHYENVYRDIFKSKIDHHIQTEPQIRHIFLEIFNLMGDKDTAIETINKKINEILDKLSKEQWIYVLDIWSMLDEEASEESKAHIENEKKSMKENEENDDLTMLLNPVAI